MLNHQLSIINFCLIAVLGLLFITNNVSANDIAFDVCPICTTDGQLICPVGFEAVCQNEVQDKTEPKCLFQGNQYIAGCWKYAGYKKLDFNFLQPPPPSTMMIEVIGGGEIYTLNREIIGCKRL